MSPLLLAYGRTARAMDVHADADAILQLAPTVLGAGIMVKMRRKNCGRIRLHGLKLRNSARMRENFAAGGVQRRSQGNPFRDNHTYLLGGRYSRRYSGYSPAQHASSLPHIHNILRYLILLSPDERVRSFTPIELDTAPHSHYVLYYHVRYGGNKDRQCGQGQSIITSHVCLRQ